MAPQEPPARPELTVVTGLQDAGPERPGRRQDEGPERLPDAVVVLLVGPEPEPARPAPAGGLWARHTG